LTSDAERQSINQSINQFICPEMQ